MALKKTGQRWPLADAQFVAEGLVRLLEPACERIAIAGSIRRRKPDVGDIELLCVPTYREMRDLWGPYGRQDMLTTRVQELMHKGILQCRPAGKSKSYTFGPQNKLMVHCASGIPVDIFSTTQANWGMALLVRTGPAEFNIRVMARLKALGHRGHAYGGITLHAADPARAQELACPDEETVFRTLGWPYIEPERRF